MDHVDISKLKVTKEHTVVKRRIMGRCGTKSKLSHRIRLRITYPIMEMTMGEGIYMSETSPWRPFRNFQRTMRGALHLQYRKEYKKHEQAN